MERYGFNLVKETNIKRYYKKIENIENNFLGISNIVEVIIQNKDNGNLFLKKVITYTNGKKILDTFCLSKELLMELILL